jgi:hypothetical protein
MPRLTAKDYLRTHDRLRKLWLQDAGLFAELSPTEQRVLHDFFVPARELSDLQLLQYRDAVTTALPSLPHQAGRALSRFWETTTHVGMKRVARAKAPTGGRKVKQADRHLVVKPLVRPEIDAQKMARAYINLAYDLNKAKDDTKSDETKLES